MDPRVATKAILDGINLESDLYRMGHTKVSIFDQSRDSKFYKMSVKLARPLREGRRGKQNEA